MISVKYLTPALAAAVLVASGSETFGADIAKLFDGIDASIGPASPAKCTISDPLSEVYIKVAPNADGGDCDAIEDSKYSSIVECKDGTCTVSDYDIPPLSSKVCLSLGAVGKDITKNSLELSVTKIDGGGGSASLLTSLVSLPLGLKLSSDCGPEKKTKFDGFTGDSAALLEGIVPDSEVQGIASNLQGICGDGVNATFSLPPNAAAMSELKANATDAKEDDSKDSSGGMLSMLGPMLGDLSSTLDGMKISLTATINANDKDAMSCDAVVTFKKK